MQVLRAQVRTHAHGEELHDSIVVATERPTTSGTATSNGPRMAMQSTMPIAVRASSDLHGRLWGSNRNTPPHPPTPSPLQPIMMMRSPVVNERVLAQKDRRVQRLTDSYSDIARWWTSYSWHTLSREPIARRKGSRVSAMEKDRVQGDQNIQWRS
jgi:hypothetical protein